MDALEEEPEVMAIEHPLETHVILDLVLAYIKPLATFEDRKNIRAVCKTWYFQTLAQWRATAFINVKLGPTLHQNQPESPGVSMSEFLTLIENDNSEFSQFTDKPFQKYKLQNLVLDVSAVKKNNLFWTCVGPNIRHLTLHEVNIKTSTYRMEEVMQFLVDQIPNLERFAVSNVYIDGKRFRHTQQAIITVHPQVKVLNILNCCAFGFASFPNLKEVTLKSCASETIASLTKSSPRQSLYFLINSTIQRLTLHKCTIERNQFLLLRYLALKHLSVDRDIRTSADVVALPEFIKSHAETLETIEVFGSLTKVALNGTCMISKYMPILTDLRAWGVVFLTLNFIRHTPNLKLLHLDLYGFEQQEKIKKNLNTGSVDGRWYFTSWDLGIGIAAAVVGDEQTPWQHLHYFQINYELKTYSLEALANLMPNLKTLKTVLNKDTFPVVCEKWSELEHLECMFGSNILNGNITGMGNDEDSLGGQRSNALIDMEYLTTFKFHTECNKSLLSDECVATGFLRVPKLIDLSICVSPEFSQDADVLLRRGIRNVKLYQNYSTNPLHNNWQCCRDTEYKNLVFNQRQ